jgi:hypothetical protein
MLPSWLVLTPTHTGMWAGTTMTLRLAGLMVTISPVLPAEQPLLGLRLTVSLSSAGALSGAVTGSDCCYRSPAWWEAHCVVPGLRVTQ